MSPIDNDPISVINSVGEDRQIFKSIRLTSLDIDLIADCLANAEFTDSPNGRAELARVNAILDVIENLPRNHSRQQAQLKMFKIIVLPTTELSDEEEQDTREYEHEDKIDKWRAQISEEFESERRALNEAIVREELDSD